MTDAALARAQVGAEIAHWRYAVDALMDLDAMASASAWAGLRSTSAPACATASRAWSPASGLKPPRSSGPTSAKPTRRGSAGGCWRSVRATCNSKPWSTSSATRSPPGPTPTTAALLRGLDVLAADSMALALGPLGLESPPALVYLDKGLGASILRAGVRLWDQANPSPVAAIKLTRHNASHPTALFHETGHQVGHLTGWNGELAQALRRKLAPRSAALAETWESWASEVAADIYAFCLAGWAPLPALANVVDGRTAAVFRVIPGDPHPFPWIRVQFNAALCRSWFGPGPWDRVAQAWRGRHDLARAPREGAELARLSMAAMPELVEVCTRTPLRAMGGRPVTALVDPRRASPAALEALARQAGASLLTSVTCSGANRSAFSPGWRRGPRSSPRVPASTGGGWRGGCAAWAA